MIRNIDKMYYNYGYKDGHFCHECPHFRKACWNKKSNKKVIGYEPDGKEIVERESFIACGLFDKPFPDDSSELPGQLKMTLTDG